MLHLGSIGKTSIDVDTSFIILIVFFVVMNYDKNLGVQYALVWIPVLFVSVLVHELAHAAVIAMFGFGASQVILGGMGGVTVNRRKARPWQDMLISVAGPLSSFALMWAAQWAWFTQPVVHTDQMLAALVPRMALANQFWGMFNLIPVPPLDGGHAVRDFFRMFLTERSAFITAIWIAIVAGGGIAVYLFIGGQLFLALFVAWFAFMAFQRWQYFRDHGIPGE